MTSNLSKYIVGQTLGKAYLLCGHLWIEHLLVRALTAKLPNPNAIFRGRTPTFQMLVSLCEAHTIIEPKLAEALRSINIMRNKCAHHAQYEPTDAEFAAVRGVLEQIGEPLPPPGASGQWGEPIEILAEMLERRARAVGATDIEALLLKGTDYQTVAKNLPSNRDRGVS